MTAAGNGGPVSAYEAVKALVLDRVEAGELDPTGPAEEVRGRIGEVVRAWQRRAHLDERAHALADPEAMVERVMTAVCDYGPLSGLLGRGDIEDVLIHGDRLAYVTADGRMHVLAEAVSEAEYRQYVERLLQAAGRQLDATHPIVQCGLPEGGRLVAKIPPVADRLTVAIRRPVLARPTLAELVARDALTRPAAGLLWTCMQILPARLVIAGAPKAGKTTLMNALLAAIPAGRVVRVNEDTRELATPLAIGGYCQASDRPGQGLRELIRTDLLTSPDWLIVGEVKGGEAFEATRGLNAGCSFLTSLHCNQAADAVGMLTRCAAEAVGDHGLLLMRQLFAEAIDFVVYLDCDDGGAGDGELRRRRVTDIVWVHPRLRNGEPVYEPIFARDGLGRPLVWTGAAPDAATTRRLERGLPPGAGALAALLAGDRLIEALR